MMVGERGTWDEVSGMRERTSAAPFQSSSPCRISAIFSLT